MFLLDDILLSPLSGLLWVGEKLNEITQREFSDEGLIKEKLMGLQLRFEMDEIGEEEYSKQEAELLARLDAVRKAKEEEV